ncbi:hypothetical protein D3C72_404640 [compost metagenome]
MRIHFGAVNLAVSCCLSAGRQLSVRWPEAVCVPAAMRLLTFRRTGRHGRPGGQAHPNVHTAISSMQRKLLPRLPARRAPHLKSLQKAPCEQVIRRGSRLANASSATSAPKLAKSSAHIPRTTPWPVDLQPATPAAGQSQTTAKRVGDAPKRKLKPIRIDGH